MDAVWAARTSVRDERTPAAVLNPSRLTGTSGVPLPGARSVPKGRLMSSPSFASTSRSRGRRLMRTTPDPSSFGSGLRWLRTRSRIAEALAERAFAFACSSRMGGLFGILECLNP